MTGFDENFVSIDELYEEITNGNQRGVETLLKEDYPISRFSLGKACEKGFLNVVKTAISKEIPIVQDLIVLSLQNGHFRISEYLINSGKQITYNAFKFAACISNVDILKCMKNSGYILDNDRIDILTVLCIERNVNEEVLKLCIEMGHGVSINCFFTSISNRIPIIFYHCIDREMYKNSKAIQIAIEERNEEYFQILIRKGYEIGNIAILTAIERGFNQLANIISENVVMRMDLYTACIVSKNNKFIDILIKRNIHPSQISIEYAIRMTNVEFLRKIRKFNIQCDFDIIEITQNLRISEEKKNELIGVIMGGE